MTNKLKIFTHMNYRLQKRLSAGIWTMCIWGRGISAIKVDLSWSFQFMFLYTTTLHVKSFLFSSFSHPELQYYGSKVSLHSWTLFWFCTTPNRSWSFLASWDLCLLGGKYCWSKPFQLFSKISISTGGASQSFSTSFLLPPLVLKQHQIFQLYGFLGQLGLDTKPLSLSF